MTTSDIRDLLGRHAFFAGLDEAALEFIAGCGANVRFAAGDYVFRQGEPADEFYVIRAGRVAVEIASPDRGPLVIDTVGEGETLGVSWLFPPYRCQFDARAVELTRAVSLDAVCLRAKCEEDPRLGFALMQRVAGVMRQRMQSARIRLLDLYSHARVG
ncbi:MAG TPA: cyclic nucleotide-binding domain-containing protein [Egibacteraceae bacterium]|nr:cyclic nucleotide-binding domain-containing protein [Egibacteraceae bacterium]